MLGVGWATICDSLRDELLQGLKNVTRAPLKPHQQMVILKNFSMPKHLHELVLAPVSDGWLNWLNTTIRANLCQLCKWLKLPKYTPKAFFHAGTGDGGLKVLSLWYSVPVMRKRCLKAVYSVTDQWFLNATP